MRAALAVALAGLVLGGCSAVRVRDGVYRSDKGYRVTVPATGWQVVEASRADLELRRADARAGILVYATCGRKARDRAPEDLERAILAGFSDRHVLERGTVAVNGRDARRLLLDARARPDGERMRLELVVVKGEACVHDLVYAAAPGDFPGGRPAFAAVLRSFALE